MKVKEIRDLSLSELKQKLAVTEEELFNLRMRLTTKQLENPMKIRLARRSIARMKTFLVQKSRQTEQGSRRK